MWRKDWHSGNLNCIIKKNCILFLILTVVIFSLFLKIHSNVEEFLPVKKVSFEVYSKVSNKELSWFTSFDGTSKTKGVANSVASIGKCGPGPDKETSRNISEVFFSLLGPTNGTEDMQEKLFMYLKTKAKLTFRSSIFLLAQHVQQIQSWRDIQSHQFTKYFEDVIVPFRIPYPSYSWKGRQLPILTARIKGRTGNIMGEYATLYALHRIYNVSVMLHPDMKNALSKDFPHLSIKDILSEEECGNSDWWDLLLREGTMFSYGSFELAAAGLFGPRLFQLGGFGFEIQLFNFFYEDLKKEFMFSPELQRQASIFLQGVIPHFRMDKIRDITYVGFHVRRTDYLNHVNVVFNSTALPGDTYFELALNYYRKKFPHPIFIVASDNTTFVQESIIGKQKDVYISEGKSAMEDMAILASCNHTIVTMGTYGFWGGYLAGGEVVYPVDSHQKQPYRLNDRLYNELNLPNFTPIIF